MALLTMIFRKLANNRWLAASLLLGMVLTTGLVSTMPVYSDAILSRMLVKDLERRQQDSGVHSGTYFSKITLMDMKADKKLQAVSSLDRFMNDEAVPGFGLPLKQAATELQTEQLVLEVEGSAADPKQLKPTGAIRSVSGIQDHIRLIDGRLPSPQPDADGAYEVMVNQRTLQELDFVLGRIVRLDDDSRNLHLRLKPVGSFGVQQEGDLFFRDPSLDDYNRVFVMDEGLFAKEMLAARKAPLFSASWYFVLDYTKMTLRGIEPFLSTDQAIRSAAGKLVPVSQTKFDVPAAAAIDSYGERSQRLATLMWSLDIPVLIMLAFYMYMVSELIAGRQKNEIAVLRSRGASRLQIISAFAAEGLMIAGAAFAAGPYLAAGLTELLGASSGFLQFVQRSRLPVHVGAEAFAYSGAAAAIAFAMTLLPVIRATRFTIVGHKQSLARAGRTPLWRKAFVDIILLGVSFYGLYTFRERLHSLKTLGLGSEDLRIDPLQFVVPALFMIGAGLLLLRLYPLLLAAVYRLGRRWWPPSWYASLIQVGRSLVQYQFLMLFLILTIASGVFSAGAARTINNNREEQIRYRNGADFVLSGPWQSDVPADASAYSPGGGEAKAAGADSPVVHYTEPPFDAYPALPGVEHAAKVFIKKDAAFTAGGSGGTAELMGIDSDDFGATAWFGDSILRYPLADYLNLIAPDPRAVLISQTLAEDKKVKPGDTIWAGWDKIDPQPFVVYGILPFFPSFNPNPGAAGGLQASQDSVSGSMPMLIVGHLSRIQFQLALEPYQVWLKMKPGASTARLYEGISHAGLNLTSIVNTRDELARAKNDPFFMALNGILTLGFLISILVAFAGFMLYWILTLKGRTLQNGVLRAVGLSLRQLIGMLALEQLLTSGTAVLIGMAAGYSASRLFVPHFQLAFDPAALVPPFRVILAAGDFAKLYGMVGMTLLIGLAVLGIMLSRSRIHQALKLGED
ncbi:MULTISPECIES: ABC transporter permease [unclassified Paenibacillus]|uniref:ABC transporter permease n=1 Tax=unclassified Paenibacillus TaxID=185978 RepID=UPI000954E3DD|nr:MULTISPECIES: ABC transporter permease [unclassified Paenibacillus]ASS64798.1 ABC transporter permease [Paenibacillus sp. RUD330]SIR05642.1 putative ABC transport system permease protein [Paenibacillus sp. RU4X]SIR29750.1 putative ABC transport system permease protein [Paenibacillus sp. RU4T]